jgi:hypothetical protein
VEAVRRDLRLGQAWLQRELAARFVGRTHPESTG